VSGRAPRERVRAVGVSGRRVPTRSNSATLTAMGASTAPASGASTSASASASAAAAATAATPHCAGGLRVGRCVGQVHLKVTAIGREPCADGRPPVIP
jgi:hypothetical protein